MTVFSRSCTPGRRDRINRVLPAAWRRDRIHRALPTGGGETQLLPPAYPSGRRRAEARMATMHPSAASCSIGGRSSQNKISEICFARTFRSTQKSSYRCLVGLKMVYLLYARRQLLCPQRRCVWTRPRRRRLDLLLSVSLWKVPNGRDQAISPKRHRGVHDPEKTVEYTYVSGVAPQKDTYRIES